MKIRSILHMAVPCMLAGLTTSLVACSDDAEETVGRGSVAFTTWGEDYIESEIPAAPPAEEGMVDGWTIQYSKFLIVLRDVTVADGSGEEAARMTGSKLFDMHAPGVKPVVAFDSLPAKAWESVSFVVGPADDGTDLGDGATQADLDMMRAGGFSVHVEATATRGDEAKTFAWSFEEATLYRDCKAEVDGKETHGVVVTEGGSGTIEITIHGDHFFCDDLDAATAERRFDAIACADANGDGDVSLEELSGASLLPDLAVADEACRTRPTYRPGSQPVNDLEAFVRALSRTLGHYRGEGECVSTKAD